MADSTSSILINNAPIALDEASLRLRTALGDMSPSQAALCFAFYDDKDLVHYATLDAAEEALFAPPSFGRFLLPRQGATNTQYAPCLVMTPEGDPLNLVWYATFIKNGNFTQIGEYFDTRNNRDMGKMAVPMTVEELGKLSARFQTGFISHIKTLPRDVRAASVRAQNILSLASKKVNNYYTSLNNAMQLRTAPTFLKTINGTNTVATQLITNPLFPKPSTAPAPVLVVDGGEVDDEEDEELRTLTATDLLKQQGEHASSSPEDAESGQSPTLNALPDSQGHFANLMRQYDVAHLKMNSPCVRDCYGRIIHPTQYATQITDGAFMRVSANLQTYQFTNRTGTLVRVLQLRLVSMDVLPSSLEGILKKYPALAAQHIEGFEALSSTTETVPLFAEVHAFARHTAMNSVPVETNVNGSDNVNAPNNADAVVTVDHPTAVNPDTTTSLLDVKATAKPLSGVNSLTRPKTNISAEVGHIQPTITTVAEPVTTADVIPEDALTIAKTAWALLPFDPVAHEEKLSPPGNSLSTGDNGLDLMTDSPLSSIPEPSTPPASSPRELKVPKTPGRNSTKRRAIEAPSDGSPSPSKRGKNAKAATARKEEAAVLITQDDMEGVEAT